MLHRRNEQECMDTWKLARGMNSIEHLWSRSPPFSSVCTRKDTQVEHEVEIIMYDGGARKFHCDDDDALMANDTKFTFSILFARACVYPSLFRTEKKTKKIILFRF